MPFDLICIISPALPCPITLSTQILPAAYQTITPPSVMLESGICCRMRWRRPWRRRATVYLPGRESRRTTSGGASTSVSTPTTGSLTWSTYSYCSIIMIHSDICIFICMHKPDNSINNTGIKMCYSRSATRRKVETKVIKIIWHHNKEG